MIHRVDGMYHEVPNFHYSRSIQRFTEEISKKIYLQLLMTQCMVHCVQYLYTILIFNPFATKVEIKRQHA